MSSVTTWPVLSPLELRPLRLLTSEPPTPLQMPQRWDSMPQTPTSVGSGQGAGTGSVFAVVMVDSVVIYDTQQAGAVVFVDKVAL